MDSGFRRNDKFQKKKALSSSLYAFRFELPAVKISADADCAS
jgi:hypothetical protein